MKATNGCEICSGTFSATRVVCASCRRDPANAQWVRDVDGDNHRPEPQRWVVSDLERQIARELLFGSRSVRGAARALGCSPSTVRWFVTRLFSDGRTNRRASDGTSLPVTPTACEHVWIAASELGMAMYVCTSCDQHGRRKIASGKIEPMKSQPRAEPTVGASWSEEDRITFRNLGIEGDLDHA